MSFKILCWNINGFRSIIKKDFIVNNEKKEGNTFENFLKKENADIITLSEIKADCSHNNLYDGFLKDEYRYKYWSHCTKTKGRNGVAVFSKYKPINVKKGLVDEGRYIELEFDSFYLVSVYQPNSGEKLKRLEFRTEIWDPLLLKKLIKLKSKKNVILCGDMNVIHYPIDTSNFEKQLNKISGVTEKEMQNFHKIIKEGFVDVYSELNPKMNKVDYTYFSYYTKGRLYNKGMRIDYFIINEELKKCIKDYKVLNNIYGSDHLPIVLYIDNTIL